MRTRFAIIAMLMAATAAIPVAVQAQERAGRSEARQQRQEARQQARMERRAARPAPAARPPQARPQQQGRPNIAAQRDAWANHQADRAERRELGRPPVRTDRQDFRRERREDRREFRQERREDRRDLRQGDVTRPEFRADRRDDRRDFRRDRREDRRDFRQDRRDDRQSWNRGNGGWSGNDGRWDRNDRRWDRGNGQWNRGWRNDRRYDWQRYRQANRQAYRVPRYYAPRGWGYGYRPFSIGITISSILYGQNYWINDPWQYRLPPAYGPYRWVRYYDDVLLVDVRSGHVVDVIQNFFW